MFYDYLDSLCAERGITVSGLLETMGISKSSASRWRTKGYQPSRPVAKKIADYFGISVRQLMGEDGAKGVPAGETSGDAELMEMLENIRRNPDLRILFSLSKNASPEDVKKYIQMIKLMDGDRNGKSDR